MGVAEPRLSERCIGKSYRGIHSSCDFPFPAFPAAPVSRIDSAARPAPPRSILDVPRTVWWSVFFLVWTLQAGLYAYATYYRRAGTEEGYTAGEAILVAAIDWYLWAAICVFCFWVARRIPLERYRLWFIAPGLVVISLAITTVRGIMDQGIAAMLGWEPITLAERLIPVLPGRFILVLLFIGVGYAIEYIRLHRERELTAISLRAELATTQLQMLKVQIHPHFLFNTLHAISSLMHIDVDAADRMLARLSELLRRTLQTMDAQTVTLAEEMSFLEPYLEIERIRLDDRLRVEVAIEPGTHSALVPHLILQPLVENAIRHGIAPKVEGGTLGIRSRTEKGDLILTVTDDGMGLHGERAEGIGLANTRQRLAHLYGGAAAFTIEPQEGGGTHVEISVPLSRAMVSDTETNVSDRIRNRQLERI